jgi:hypothetical protein
MTAKKNATHDTPQKTRKARRRKGAATENLTAAAAAPAEVVLTENAPTPADPAEATEAAETLADPTPAEPTAEASRCVSPMSAEETTGATADRSAEPEVPANKLSALDAAAKVLGETGQALSCPEMIATTAAKGYWSSPKGRTPAGTLYSALLRELQTKGERARFVKVGRGRFALRGVR